MEEPNAQSVGREFVRQYYTMLNEGPGYLHRFYSHNSSFLHGGVERPGEELEPAIGQSEIHKKIAQLEFHDCHAKIRQVDSQSSVEGSVVIQVIGELSNRGQPMRRFMQTFVLAPQSPKKYYLHNDIFRYQDEVFQDLSTEVDCAGDEIYGIDRRLADVEVQQQPLVVEEVETEERAPLVCYYEPTVQQQPTVVSNGTGIHEESSSDSTGLLEGLSGDGGHLEVTSTQDAPGSAEPIESTLEQVPVEQNEIVEVNKSGNEETEVENERHTETPVTTEEIKVEKVVECVQPQEPVPVVPAQKPTWAAMASRNTSAPVSAGPGSASGSATKPQATIRPEPKTMTQQRSAVVPNGGGLPQRTPRTTIPGPPASESSSTGGIAGSAPGSVNNDGIPRAASVENGRGGGFEGGRDVGGDDSRRAGGGPIPSIYPDTQQVFVGNVPHFVVDLELKEFFEQYGPVADIRINRKTSNSLPNFGFVSFETADAVQALLSARPLPKLHGKHRLNVEEKKAKEELARPRSSGPRAPQLGAKSPAPYNRTGDNYAPSAGRGRGGINNTGGGQQNNGGGGGYQGVTNNGGGKGYNKGYTSDEGHIGTAAASQAPSTQNNLR